MTATLLTADDSRSVGSLIDFALESLPAMCLEDGAFCFERRVGKAAPIGRSARYTLMVELGLLRAQSAGYVVPLGLEKLDAVAWHEPRRVGSHRGTSASCCGSMHGAPAGAGRCLPTALMQSSR